MNGYEIPIHKSLTEKILVGGIPKNYATINWAVGLALGLNGGSWYMILVSFIIHLFLAYCTKTDVQFFECLRTYFYNKKYYGT